MTERRRKIIELRKSRVKPSRYFENFFYSFFRATRLMHSCITHMRDDETLFNEAKRNYIISLTSCLETFYRDLLIHVLNKDRSHLENIMSKIKEKKSLLDIYKMLEEKITFHEYVASHFKFQNIEEIENTFSTLFHPKGYLNSLEQHKHTCYILSKSSKATKLTLHKEWRKDFAFLFSSRHKLVHDANSICDISPSKMAKLEFLVLQICQFTSFLVDKKYGKTMALEKNGKPAFFIVADFLSEDWEVADDGHGYKVVSRP